jgi:hypothetical protein
MIHGMIQRVSDSAAIPCDKLTGKSATPQMKFDAMKPIVDHYMSGSEDWAIKRSEGGKREASADVFVLQALADVQKLDVTAMKAAVERNAEKRGLTVKQYLTNAATIPAVAARVLELKTAAIAPIDSDEWLNELAEAPRFEGEDD